MRKNRFSSGFTLIELLIVIVIIGVLTSLLTANFIGARQRSRDAKRKSDLRQIQSALELYRADTGIYPTEGEVTCGNTLQSEDTNSTYMQQVPCDPNVVNSGYPAYKYEPAVDRGTYQICACLENDSDPDGSTTSACATDLACPTILFTVQSP